MLRTSSRTTGRLALGAGAVRALVYALFVVAGIAQSAIVPLLPRISERYHLSASQTALLLALPGLATLIVSVPAGVASDRIGARRVTLAAAAVIAFSSLAQAAPSLAAVLAGRVAFGVGFGVVWTSAMAWLAELDGASSTASLGAPVTYSSAGTMLGPAVAGALAQSAGLAAPFIAVAIAAA
ncbi:MAG: MFS transporter, partial [Solirubrobacteraceae bacterium]